MKKYTNKILIITAIAVVLSIVIGYTIDFQTGYRSGKIKYEERNLDSDSNSLEMLIRVPRNGDIIIDTVETGLTPSLQEDETASEKEPETSHQ
jgi:hypothetical protein